MFEKIEKFVSCVCVSVMAILVFANAVSRFAFKHSMAVSDEMSTYLFVLMSFMGTAVAARRDELENLRKTVALKKKDRDALQAKVEEAKDAHAKLIADAEALFTEIEMMSI